MEIQPIIQFGAFCPNLTVPSLDEFGGKAAFREMFGGLAFANGIQNGFDFGKELSVETHSRVVGAYRDKVLIQAKGAEAIQHQVLRSQNWDGEVIEVGPDAHRWNSLPSGSMFLHPITLGPTRARPGSIAVLMRAIPLSIIEAGIAAGVRKGLDLPNEWGLLRAIGYAGP